MKLRVSSINLFSSKKQGKRCRKKHLSKEAIRKIMAEDLNGYFSSVFTKEDISSLPVADAKFQGAKSHYLGPLVVTPELVAKKIKAMKDNKSPGVDAIPPKLLLETVEQISILLA